MKFVYDFLIYLFDQFLPFIGKLNAKLKLFAEGRKGVIPLLKNSFRAQDKVIWMHCASLGEYEQGVPVLQEIKKQFPNHKVLVTFFSPSGYEAKKNSDLVDLICYLPLDTKANAKTFIKAVNPELAIFVKYEFWPNYINSLYQENIPIIFISAVFRKDQLFFKTYGRFMKKALRKVDHFFVQDQTSQQLISEAGFENVTLSGDTRFDRVSHQIEMNNQLDFVEEFVGNRLCVVLGSTWAEDETIFMDFMNAAPSELCFIIAPHEIKSHKVESLQIQLVKQTVLFSEKEGKKLNDFQVLILDTIGYLSRVYSYADIAYVGGAMGTSGLHNILEPATFGIPILIGKNFENFREAKQLQKLAGLFSVATQEEFNKMMSKLIEDNLFREKTGLISGHFINSNTGATAIIMDYIHRRLIQN